MTQYIGLIGLGDLGSKLAVQMLHSGMNVAAYDTATSDLQSTEAVDPAIQAIPAGELASLDLNGIVSASRLIHWAVPSAALSSLPPLPAGVTVVLHDSVMSNSQAAIAGRPDKAQFVIVHCLTNDQRRVLVCKDYGPYAAVEAHLRQIGLDPAETTVDEHDVLMARTQGVFALLLQLGMREELDYGFANGNLTPSAIELRDAVINRESRWTADTLHSILKNPQLLPFVEEMAVMLRSEASDIDHVKH